MEGSPLMRTDPTRLALVVAAILTLSLGGDPTVPMLLLPPAAAILLAASYRRDVRVLTLLLLFAGAVLIRAAIASRTGSDVLTVTTAAINRVLAGVSPYGAGYVESTPDGAPFPYGPAALLWYLPLKDKPDLIELGAAIVVSAALLLRGRLLGLAVYGTMSLLVASSVDGSNDTSLGLILLVAFVLAGRWPALGAVALAVAVGFKLSALAWVPAFIAWGGLRPAAAFVSASLPIWAPVVSWGVDGFVWSTAQANAIHPQTIWSLGKVVEGLTGSRLAALDQLRFLFGGLAAVATTLWARRSLDRVFLAGSIVYLFTLFGGNWSTFAYFAALGPMFCWRLDDWLGLETRPIAIPLPSFLRRRSAEAAPIGG